MIVSACVIFKTLEGKEIQIPCHRHKDAFFIIDQFGLTEIDESSIQTGFLDDKGRFLQGELARAYAFSCGQTNKLYGNLRSEDLW